MFITKRFFNKWVEENIGKRTYKDLMDKMIFYNYGHVTKTTLREKIEELSERIEELNKKLEKLAKSQKLIYMKIPSKEGYFKMGGK